MDELELRVLERLDENGREVELGGFEKRAEAEAAACRISLVQIGN